MQRLSGELSASERKLDLTASDLSAERDRVAAQAALLERKVQQPAGRNREALYRDIRLSLFGLPKIQAKCCGARGLVTHLNLVGNY